VDGLIVARRPDFDVAILDMNLAGLTSLRIADTLIERDIPFLLITGYTAGGVPDRFGHVVRLSKPIEKAVLEKALQDLLSGNPSAPAR
jgi:CheY-like chemotaxis protein